MNLSALLFYTKSVSLLAILFSISCSGHALPEDKNQAIEILADSAERDENLGTTIYAGNVIITQGTLIINADKVTIHSIKTSSSNQAISETPSTTNNSKENKNTSTKSSIKTIIATGTPATLLQQLNPEGEMVDAKANTLHYIVNERLIHLLGAAELIQNGNFLSGEKIYYDMNAQRVQAQSNSNADSSNSDEKGGRVRVIIPPQN